MMKEKWQEDVLTNKLEELCEKITFNPLLLDGLENKNQISKEENEELTRIKDAEEFGGYIWKSKLLKYLVTRENAYDVLFQVLIKVNQTDAAAILRDGKENAEKKRRELDESSPSKRPRIEKSLQNSHQLLEKERKIIWEDYFRGDLRFQSNWTHIFRSLNVPLDMIEQHQITLFKKTATLEQIYTDCLESWRSADGKGATVEKLISILYRFQLVDIADGLREEFDISLEDLEEQEEPLLPSTTWSNLNKERKTVLLGRNITFQQRLTSLKTIFEELECSKKFINTFLEKHVDKKLLADLHYDRNPIIIKDTTPAKLYYYIDRTFISRRRISKDIFKNDTDIFLVSGVERHELFTLAGREVSDLSGSQVMKQKLSSRHILLQLKHHYEDICQKTEKPVHWLEGKSGVMHWKKSQGDLKVVQECISINQESMKEVQLLSEVDKEFHGPVCISDTPGMGKSVLLANLGRELRNKCPQKIVIFVLLSSFMAKMKTRKKNTEDLIKSLLELCCPTPFEVEVGRLFLEGKEKKTEILFDGFDEVYDGDVNLTLECLTLVSSLPGVRVWVTTRPHHRDAVEDSLKSLAYNIQAFQPNNQERFLVRYWSQPSKLDRNKLLQFARACLEKLAEIGKDKQSTFAGVPLQCLLVAEVFAKHAINFSNPENIIKENLVPSISINSTMELFEQYVRNKLELFSERYYGGRSLTPAEFEDFENSHIFYSMQVMYPHDCKMLELVNIVALDTLLKVGLIQIFKDCENPQFIHRTFAEYFAARFVLTAIKKEVELSWVKRAILDCSEVSHQKHSIKSCLQFSSLTNYSFVSPVVMYFLNCLVDSETPPLPCSMDFSDSKIDKILNASISDNHLSIFQWLCKTPNFSKHVNSEHLFLSVVYGDLDFFEAVIEIYQQNDTSPLPLLSRGGNVNTESKNFSLLRAAARRGNYHIFENLLKKHGFEDILRQDTPSKFVLHDCVEYSNEDEDDVLASKEEIITAILQVNRSLLEVEDEYSRTPLLAWCSHYKLVEKLISSGANLLQLDKRRQSILSCVPRYLSSDEYDKLIRTIPPYTFRRLISFQEGKWKDPVYKLLKWIEPLESTLEYFKQEGYDFSIYNTHQKKSLVKVAIRFGRSVECVKKLMDCGASRDNIDSPDST